MDSILILGAEDKKLIKFLEKMGQSVFLHDDTSEVSKVISANVIDLIILDSRVDIDIVELCQFFRAEEATKTSPIICITNSGELMASIKEAAISYIEYVEFPYSIGRLVSRISTLLRLRKTAGRDEETASLSQVNAALRDLTDKFERDLKEAQTIQESLLPSSFPQDDRFAIAVTYEPLEGVGGDWYFVRKEDSGKISVQIADVTGHGLSAAFIGSMTKLAMDAAGTEAPNELLARMNGLMAPLMPEGKFVTMFSYLFDPETGHLDYARAGHLPGFLLRRKQDEVVELLGDGFAVGFFEMGEYTPEEDLMDVNDILIIMTDGIPEGQNMARENYGYEHFCKIMRESDPDDGPEVVLEKIINHFEEFRGGRVLKDDVTVIALKRLK